MQHISAQAKKDFARLIHTTVHLNLNGFEAFIIISELQLALRQPNQPGFAASTSRTIANILQSHLCLTPALMEIIEAGWYPQTNQPNTEHKKGEPYNDTK